MKIKNKLNKLISGFTLAVICFTMLPSVQTFNSEAAAGDKYVVDSDTNQHFGYSDDYTYDVWFEGQGGSGSITLGQQAAFKAEWNATLPNNSFLARRGEDFSLSHMATDYDYIGLDYEVDFRHTAIANGSACLSVYGWMQNHEHSVAPFIEYFIIENWVDWCPDAKGKMVTIDGAEYKIFKVEFLDMGIDGSYKSIKRYYSVRQSKRSSGHITVSDHFKAWENEGWAMAYLSDVTLCAEGYQSSGYADVKKLNIDYTTPIPQPEPEPVLEPDENGHYINEKFESYDIDFVSRGDALIDITSSVSNSGNKSLAVIGRTEPWNGVEIELDPETFKAGETYGFSVMAMQNDSPSENFSLTLQYCNSNGLTYGFDQYAYIATAKGKKGEWVQLANPSFTIPDGATNLVLYVNTYADDVATTTDFFVDDFIIALENKITVNEKSEKLIRGDLDKDGRISIFDLSLERNAIINSSSDDSYSPAADVDGDGMVAVNDLVLLSQYIHGKITKFPTVAPSIETASE